MAETFDPLTLPSVFDPFGADALPAPRGRHNTAKPASPGQAERQAPLPLPRSHTNDVTAARLATLELAVAALNARFDALEETTEARLTELEDTTAARLDDQMGRFGGPARVGSATRPCRRTADGRRQQHHRPGHDRRSQRRPVFSYFAPAAPSGFW